jgi:hypothetical protein
MNDIEDEVRRLLDARAERVHSNLTGPAIRARAQRRSVPRRYGPLVSAVGVLAVALVSVVVLRHSTPTPTPSQPASPPVNITSVRPPFSTVTQPPEAHVRPGPTRTETPAEPPSAQSQPASTPLNPSAVLSASR